jgi:hypothetical protein
MWDRRVGERRQSANRQREDERRRTDRRRIPPMQWGQLNYIISAEARF